MAKRKKAAKPAVEENLTVEGDPIPEGEVLFRNVEEIEISRVDKGAITISASDLDRYLKSGWKLK